MANLAQQPSQLSGVNRLLLTVPLRPIQTDRFQPTGFPNLGHATYQTKEGQKLLVELVQPSFFRLAPDRIVHHFALRPGAVRAGRRRGE